MFYSSPNCRNGQNKGGNPKQELSFLLVSLDKIIFLPNVQCSRNIARQAVALKETFCFCKTSPSFLVGIKLGRLVRSDGSYGDGWGLDFLERSVHFHRLALHHNVWHGSKSVATFGLNLAK